MDNFDSLVDDSQAASAAPIANAGAAPSFDALQDDEDKYGTPGQQAITGLEGVGRGVAGPLAPMLEKSMGVNPEDILAREKTNPITHGVGEGVGLVGSTLLAKKAPVSLAGVMSKAGEGAQAALGLANVAKEASWGTKVGSAAAQQAAEMAVMQGSDEAAKMILKDPDTSAQTAISNIGLASALGVGSAVFMTGGVSPLWQATAGPKVEAFLNGMKEHVNGSSKLLLPTELAAAEKALGMEIDPIMRAGISGEPKAAQLFNELREVQHPEVIQAIDKMHHDASHTVAQALNVAPEDIANYSENQAGHDLIQTFKKEYEEKFAPIQKQYDALKEASQDIKIPDEERLQQYGKIIEKGQSFGAVGAPQQKIFDEYGERLLSQNTIGQTDKLVTEINNEIKKAMRAGDTNTMQAFREIKTSVQDFQERQINKAALETAVSKAERGEAKAMSADLIAERQAASAEYAKIARVSDEMSQQMGLGEFRGYKGLLNRLADKKSPEQVLKALSTKGNADLIPFLSQHFPQVLEKIRENELKQLIRPAVLGAKNADPINMRILGNAVEKGLAGKAEHVKFALPPGALEKIQAAKALVDAIPAYKSSGTAGWQQKLMKHFPASASAAVSLIMGHNPIAGYISGHATQLLGRNAPDAVKLGLLRFMATDKPVKAEGFKAAVEFIHAVQKGESVLNKATVNVFKPGVSVLVPTQWPSSAEIMKLDKMVASTQKAPGSLIDDNNSHVGHYLPDHQVSLAATSTNAVQYLQSIKPHAQQTGPLDRPIDPTPAQIARYHRALEIAQQPAVVLQHLKDGTLQASDVADLNAMYPGVYKNMVMKLSNNMTGVHAQEEPIPYKTRMGMSLFMAQPIDSTMQPTSILAAQPKPQQPPQQQGKGNGPAAKLNKMDKSIPTYLTPNEASQKRRLTHE